MNIHYSTNLLNKANNILELIGRVDSQLTYHNERLRAFDKSKPFDFICLFYDRDDIVNKLKDYKYIKARLKQYYLNTLNKLTQNAIHEFNPINN